MSNRSKRYSAEFKQSLVAIYHDEHRSMCSIAREYGIGVSTVSKWIKENQVITNVDDKPVTRKDFQKLQKKYARLQEENEILKAAAVILGNTHDNKKY